MIFRQQEEMNNHPSVRCKAESVIDD